MEPQKLFRIILFVLIVAIVPIVPTVSYALSVEISRVDSISNANIVEFTESTILESTIILAPVGVPKVLPGFTIEALGAPARVLFEQGATVDLLRLTDAKITVTDIALASQVRILFSHTFLPVEGTTAPFNFKMDGFFTRFGGDMPVDDEILAKGFANNERIGGTLSALVTDVPGTDSFFRDGKEDINCSVFAGCPGLTGPFVPTLRSSVDLTFAMDNDSVLLPGSIDVVLSPEPASLLLLSSGLAGIAGLGRKRLFRGAPQRP